MRLVKGDQRGDMLDDGHFDDPVGGASFDDVRGLRRVDPLDETDLRPLLSTLRSPIGPGPYRSSATCERFE